VLLEVLEGLMEQENEQPAGHTPQS